MALTLTEAEKLSNDVLLQGVIETIIKDSPVLQMLPFIQIQGNGLTYARESTLPSIAFYDVGDTWAESTPTFAQVTSTLKIMGGDADVDNYLRSTRSNINDLEAAVVEQKAKALRHTFEEYFVYGNSATSSKQFDGVRKLINTAAASAQLVAAGATGAARPEIRGHHSPIVRTEMSMVSPHFRALDVNMAMILNGAKGNPNVGARCRVPAGGMGVVGICRGGTCPSRSKELDQFHEERRGSQVRTQRICRGSASDNGRDMSLPYRYSPELPVTPAPRRQSERAAKRPRGDGN